ncbi:MAG: ferritin-like domain-containing protein [Polyangiaceae bacterium]
MAVAEFVGSSGGERRPIDRSEELVEYFPADTAAWISDTPLRTEYARLMRGFHRPIPWEATHAPSLDADVRAELARIWGERIPTEYRSITGFSTFSFDLIAAGAPVDLVAVCHRVCIDELRHTELAVRMVEVYGGRRPELPRDISNLPADSKLTAVAQACRSAILLSCLGETFACTELAMLRDRAVDPVVQGVLTVFLSDEIVHARIGWAYLAHAFKSADPKTKAMVAEAVPRYIEGIAANLFGTEDVAAAVDVTNDDARLAAHGVCSMKEEQELYRSFIPEVFLPGLMAVGVPIDRDACLAALPTA